MNNSDMPVNVEFKQAGDVSIKDGGLTKREYFAGLAPDNIPSWFQQEFANNAAPELTWYRKGNEFMCAESGWTQEGEIALYFAWRTYYADALLKQLDKGNK